MSAHELLVRLHGFGGFQLMVVGAMVVGLTCLSITALLLIRDKEEELETIPYLRERLMSVRIVAATTVAAILGGYILKYAVSFYVSKTVVLSLSDDDGAQIDAPLLPKPEYATPPPGALAFAEPRAVIPPAPAAAAPAAAAPAAAPAPAAPAQDEVARNLLGMFETEKVQADLVSLP